MKSLPLERRFAWLWLGLGGIAAAVALLNTVFAPIGSTHDLRHALEGPHAGAWLGTDAFGRPMGWTVLRAAATSTAFAALTVLISCAVSLVWGAGIALAGPTARYLGLRSLETLLAFPHLLFALAFAAIRGPGWDTLMLSLLIGTLPGFARLLYLRSRELLAEDFVLAAASLGARKPRILFRHLLPHLLALCRIKAPNLFAHALLAEATLSFLGIGAPIGRDTWGSLLAQGKEYLFEMPHIAWVAGIPLILTVLSLQLLSETK